MIIMEALDPISIEMNSIYNSLSQYIRGMSIRRLTFVGASTFIVTPAQISISDNMALLSHVSLRWVG